MVAASTNVAFEIEAVANADGDWEIVNVECEPTTEVTNKVPAASEIDAGSWEFRFVLPADFGSDEFMFDRFARYGLTPQTVHHACCEAMGKLKR
jgi:hypothetical protein